MRTFTRWSGRAVVAGNCAGAVNSEVGRDSRLAGTDGVELEESDRL